MIKTEGHNFITFRNYNENDEILDEYYNKCDNFILDIKQNKKEEIDMSPY
jgi:hypothetical protein